MEIKKQVYYKDSQQFEKALVNFLYDNKELTLLFDRLYVYYDNENIWLSSKKKNHMIYLGIFKYYNGCAIFKSKDKEISGFHCLFNDELLDFDFIKF